MTQQSAHLDEILNRHRELLVLSEDNSNDDISQVQAFLKVLAQAGAKTEDPDARSLLRSLIRYWSSFINSKTGKFPLIQLQPFIEIDLSDKPSTSLIAIAQSPVPSNGSSLVNMPLQKNTLWQRTKRIFEIDIYFLSAKKYRLFRVWGMIFNLSGSVILGIWQQSWWICLGSLLASLFIFLLHIVVVNKSVMLLLGTLLALFWGIVGWASETIIQLIFRINWFLSPIIGAVLFFVISVSIHLRYVRNKDLL